MKKLYVIAEKNRDGSVTISKPQEDNSAAYWLTIARHNSARPDYRHKRITLNCYTWRIEWMNHA